MEDCLSHFLAVTIFRFATYAWVWVTTGAGTVREVTIVTVSRHIFFFGHVAIWINLGPTLF